MNREDKSDDLTKFLFFCKIDKFFRILNGVYFATRWLIQIADTHAAVICQVLLKLLPWNIQLPQDGPEPAAVQTLGPDKLRQAAPQVVRILADIGHHQAAHGLHRAAVGDLLPQQQLQQAGLAAAVCADERRDASGVQVKIQPLEHGVLAVSKRQAADLKNIIRHRLALTSSAAE